MKWELSDKVIDSPFMRAVERLSGQSVRDCSQCGRCSAGCPVLPDVDVSPNRVIRMTQLGWEAGALGNEMVWACAGCGTCTGRCPMGLDIGRILDTLRAIAAQKGLVRARGAVEVRTFYRAFLDCVREFGRNSEVGLMGAYNINSGRLFTNVVKAPWFLLKSKIGLTVHKIDQLDRMQRVFERIEALDRAEMNSLLEEGT